MFGIAACTAHCCSQPTYYLQRIEYIEDPWVPGRHVATWHGQARYAATAYVRCTAGTSLCAMLPRKPAPGALEPCRRRVKGSAAAVSHLSRYLYAAACASTQQLLHSRHDSAWRPRDVAANTRAARL